MKKFFIKAVFFIKQGLGAVSALFAVVLCIMIFADRAQWVAYLIMAGVFGLLAVLLLKRKKKKEQPVQDILEPVEILDAIEPIETAEPVDAYIKVGNTIHRTDGQPISEREIPYLIEQGWRDMLEAQALSPNPKFHRTAKEKDLETDFLMRYGDASQKLADKFEELANLAYSAKEIDRKIELLTLAISKYEEARVWHYSKSKGAMLWFQDMWEYMHNSQNQCFSWADIKREYMDELVHERDVVRPKIISLVSVGPVMQKDFYGYFPKLKPSNVRRIIDDLVSIGELEKEKKGSTYLISKKAGEV